MNEELRKYKCKVCGYIYDVLLGEPEMGVKEGTLFNDIPEWWECPVCGANKLKFKIVKTKIKKYYNI
ncbi:MAG: rubredoxin [Candidatus Omnitrophica bacterium]|nr:rubredoxin [Candidatus Omnitrophota bacterium]MCM8826115.1 rubredoxin [Candidatus Omnitrophota bacterium]